MQTSSRGIRSGAARLALQPHGPVASTSAHRVVQWESRRHLRASSARNMFGFNNLSSIPNPVNWVRKKLGPQMREEQDAQAEKEARQEAEQRGELSVFETQAAEEERAVKAAAARSAAPSTPEEIEKKKAKAKATEHKYSTAAFKISHRKLNDIGRQIADKPIDYAILQMTFSEKRASKRIESMLKTAKRHAVHYKGMDASKLVVAEAWVNKGSKRIKRLDIKGRGKFGIKIHPDSRMHVVLKEGKTWMEKANAERDRKLGRIRSAGLAREDKPLRNPGPMWAW